MSEARGNGEGAQRRSSADPPAAPSPASEARSDHSPWNWLLLLPIVVPLVTVFYNAEGPRVFGFPRFYWLQLVFILLGVGTTTLVYQMTKPRAAGSGDRRTGREGVSGDVA